jgi:hypothetical protein
MRAIPERASCAGGEARGDEPEKKVAETFKIESVRSTAITQDM